MAAYDIVIKPDGVVIIAISEDGTISEVEKFPTSSLRAAVRRLDRLQEEELTAILRGVRDSLNTAVLDPAELLSRAIEKSGLKAFLERR